MSRNKTRIRKFRGGSLFQGERSETYRKSNLVEESEKKGENGMVPAEA